jgi:hypothetical protein
MYECKNSLNFKTSLLFTSVHTLFTLALGSLLLCALLYSLQLLTGAITSTCTQCAL